MVFMVMVRRPDPSLGRTRNTGHTAWPMVPHMMGPIRFERNMDTWMILALLAGDDGVSGTNRGIVEGGGR